MHSKLKLSASALTRAIDRIELDLKGRTVLTEAATGAYVVTPILAAMAGAKVLAYARDTRYGSQADVLSLLETTRRSVGAPAIAGVRELGPEVFSAADLITNSGHLRPLDSSRLSATKPGAVISLMYEAWEFRPGDLDLDFCRERGISVGATNERHPDVDVFGYLGDMAIKLMFDAGVCPYNSTLALICNNEFGPFIARTLAKVCRKLGIVDIAERKADYENLLSNGSAEWLSDFPSLRAPASYREAAAVVFTASPFERDWTAPGGLESSRLKELFPEATLLRFAGHVSPEVLRRHDIAFHPAEVRPGHMGVLPSDIGLDPILRLQTAGLKVGQCLLEGKTMFRNEEIVQALAEIPPAAATGT